jgi:acyl-coenzyme A synthetase/AMP-(fatty) acid ligase
MLLEAEAERTWLVGGGLRTPWTYRDLARALTNPAGGFSPEPTVASVLAGITRAVCRGEDLELNYDPLSREEPQVGEAAAHGDHTEISGILPDARWRQNASRVRLQTSGTTAAPRIVTHTVRDLARAVVVGERHQADVWALAFNPTHIGGIQVYLQALANRNTTVNLWGVGRDEALRRCRAWQVTHLSATPTFFRLLLPLGAAIESVKSISLGGEALDAALFEKLQAAFPAAKIHNIYASTEAGTLLKADGLEFVISPELQGRIQIREGRLWVHQSLLGQFEDAAEWYDSGDAVEGIPGQGERFRILGRFQAGINVGGEKVNPHEVEEALLQHPNVGAVRVYGRRNSVTGRLVMADVVRADGNPSESELRNYLGRMLPAYKVPRLIRFVDSLDLTGTGKVARRE